jgi:hypothetical protein
VRPDTAIGRTALVLPGGRSSSIRLGRQAVLAWLQVAPRRYDTDTSLLLVTELLARATSRSTGPFMLMVGEHDRALRVEVREPMSVGGPQVDPVDAKLLAELAAELQLITALADRWGSEWCLADDADPTWVVWFECGPSTAPPGSGR